MENLNRKSNIAIEMIEDHRSIRKTIQRLNLLFESDPSNEPQLFDSIQRIIYLLQSRVTHHFHLEEHLGILTDLVESHPRIQPQIDILFQEHQEMLKILQEIYDLSIKIGTEDLDLLKKKYFHFVTQIKEHENRENILVRDVYNIDIEGMD